VFSFLSDAGQFGANQAFTAVMATVMTIAMKEWKRKIFFSIVAVLAFYGMLISGTRGAISIPLMGFSAFFVLRKNKAVMISGFFILLLVFVFFKYTNIGQGNSQIRRMRTAFDPNDASLQVRLENQRKLKSYMASRPFGGGVGHGGVKAQKYLPNAYLSQVPTDSGYVLIWVELGIIGLALHLFILFYVIGKSSYKIMFRIRDPILKLKMSALVSGMFGIMVANYGNAVLYQMPSSILFYTSMAILMKMDSFDNSEQLEKQEVSTTKPIYKTT
jgi:O-antigen ligase